jgi:hypothetical protein
MPVPKNYSEKSAERIQRLPPRAVERDEDKKGVTKI